MFSVTACYDADDFYSRKNPSPVDENNFFDFSTTQEVDLMVDYSDFDIHGPVFFQVYSENPIVNEGEYNEYVNAKVEPIMEAYTDARGIYDETVTLPAYAKELHVVTGNFMIGLKRSVVAVSRNEASVKVERKKTGATLSKSPVPTVVSPDTHTNDISSLPCLSFNFRKNGSMGERVYKDWYTPLGTWDPVSGRPDYVADQATLDPKLCFPQEILDALYATVGKAVSSGTTCRDEYRSNVDLTLIADTELSLCTMGSMSCWNSSMGYYYYDSDHQPTTQMDLNIIMIYPNTQDGYRYEPVGGDQYQGNIGMQRGDVIQLLYYPNIANGDLTTVSTVFPKGTKIGFILKPNSWSSQGRSYCTLNGTKPMNDKMNVWVASTEGLSYCNEDMGEYRMADSASETHTAKFSYCSPDGSHYAIVTVEDACDDDDYDDFLFAVNPADVFAPLPEVEDGKTTRRGVFAFEDRWPSQGDYDMNDVMIDYVQEQFFSGAKIKRQVLYFTTYQNRVSDQSGLAVHFDTKIAPSKITMKKQARGELAPVAVTYDFDGEAYILTDDITAELETTYIMELTYSSPVSAFNLVKPEPFIFRDKEDDLRWEVHIPYEAPTSKMDTRAFHTFQDASDLENGKWYVCRGDYPFAFYLDNIRIDSFKDNILDPKNESLPIDVFFPGFIDWSTSHGAMHSDWYMRPIKR